MDSQVSPKAEAQCNGVESNRGLFLLSIDGGGIRGLSSLIILKEVLYRLQIRSNLDDIPRPCDLFDLAGGTGTGGLIVLMLFRLKMTIDQAIETYVQFTRDVFYRQQSWFVKAAFSAGDFERAIVRILQKYEDLSNPSEMRLLDTNNLEGPGKAFLCAYDARNMAFPVLFRTYTVSKNPSYNCTIVEGARATCATPKIFKSIDIGPDYLRSTYIGGEWRSNNPTQSVLSEADVLFPSQPISCLLSIGAGRINHLAFSFSFRLSHVLKNITEDCETTHQHTARQFNSDVYFRLNVEQGLHQVSWMDWKNLPAVEAHSKSYLMEAEISQRVDSLVEKLFMSKVEPTKPASDEDTVHSPLMPAPTDADIYRSRLLVEKRGFPLWIPGPDMSLPVAYRRTGITIGDVGIMSPTGNFVFLFNIFCPMDHPVNARVPADFCPLHIPDLKFMEHVFFDRKSHLSSSFLSKQSDHSPNSLVFETSEKEAAVLVMPTGALSQDLLFHRKTITKYISANAKMWCEYADGDQCGLEIHNGDLRVVYGIDKATCWAIATLKTDVVKEFSTQLEFVTVDQPGASETYRWGTVGRARGRVGPPQDEMRNLVQATGEDSLQNQCLFVRTFNFNLSGQVWDELGISPLLSSNVRRNVSDLQLPSTHYPLGGSPAPTQSTSRSGQQYLGSKANFMNSEQSIQHPSVLLNKRLLEMHPDAAMVITEDADWISVITDTDITFPSPEVICSRVLASHEIWEEDGVVTLRAIDNSRNEFAFIDNQSQISISSQSSISTEEEIQETGVDLFPFGKECSPSLGPNPPPSSPAVAPAHPPSLHHSLLTNLTSGPRAPSSASFFTSIDQKSIYGGAYNRSFVIQNQEEIHERFANHIVPEAFHDAPASFALPECYPGTREAIMRDLIHWFEQDCRTYPIYHLYAPVGSGKTVVAKTLADHFSNYDKPSENFLLATFFFSRTTENRSNARAFIATIAYQVAKNLPPVATYIMEATTSDPAIFDKNIFVQLRTLLLNPLRKACAVELECGRATSHWPRLFVIDGLDECNNTETQINILRVITELARYRPFPLAIFLSCRPELHIRNAFADPHVSGLALETDLSNVRYDSESDIRRFLESKFREIHNSHYVTTGIRLPPDWPGPEIIEMLVAKSSGHFIYPSVVVKYVGALDYNPVDRLKDVLGLAEEQPFKQLDALYSEILASIKPNYLRTVRNAFSFALVPYGGSMLLDEPKIRARLANLEGILISLVNHRRKGMMAGISVAFLHSSFSDFLLDPARSGLYYIDLKGAHADIAVYLLKKYIENNTGKESSARAIYSLIGHLRAAAPTEALRHNLRRMSEVTTFTKIFNNCNRPDDLGLSFDVWKVLQSLASCLGQLAFEESFIMKDNLLRVMKSHLRKELEKYAEGPLNQLIALLMCGARLPQDFLGQRSPSESSVKEALVSLIWQKFDFHDDVRTTDESSLNLLALLKVDQACLRSLIAEIGCTVDPGVYTKACIDALKCLAEISRGSSQDSPIMGRGSGRNANLSSEFSSFRGAAEMAQQDQEEDWWWLDSIPLASLFTHFFTDFVVRLLEHTTPSSKIAEYLDDLESDITLLCRCANRVNMHGARNGKKAKAVVRRHQTRVNYPPSPYPSRVVMLPVRKLDLSRRKSL